MNRYEKALKPYIHMELKNVTSVERMPIYMMAAFGLITYMVRVFSYTEAGPIYGASAVIALSGFYFYAIFLKQIASGKKKVHYRRSYLGEKIYFSLFWDIYVLSWGIFLGNIIYYLSRFRIWNDPSQLFNLISHTFNLSGLLIGAAISIFLYYYAFIQDKFIESDDYARRMRYKLNGCKISEKDAFLEIREEQDNFFKYGAMQLDKKEASKNNHPKQPEAAYEEEPEIDIYAEARIRRGE